MKRYQFLKQDEIYGALNRLRDAFLAAHDGKEVGVIINGLLTIDERIKIGRRIQIAECLQNGMTIEETAQVLNVGKTTIALVSKQLTEYEECFRLIEQRKKYVEMKFTTKGIQEVGASKLVYKKKISTGFSRKDVKR